MLNIASKVQRAFTMKALCDQYKQLSLNEKVQQTRFHYSSISSNMLYSNQQQSIIYNNSQQLRFSNSKANQSFRSSLKQKDKNISSLFFKSQNTFFTSVFANTKIQKRISLIEQEIESNMDNMNAQELLEKITELINLKTEFHQDSQYLGYISDLQKKSNALYSLRKTDEALSILKAIEAQVENILASGVNLKNAQDKKQETINLKIEYANTILMRAQMQDLYQNEQEANQAIQDCLKAIKILEETQQAVSDHMVVAQQTLGETFYKLGYIKESAQSIEKAAFLLEQLISEIQEKQNKKQTKQEEQENEQNMRHLTLRQAILFETLGNLHFDLRNMQQAEMFFTASLNLWENKMQNKNQNNLNTLDELVQQSTQHNIENSKRNIHPLHMRCLNSIGTFYSTSGQTIKALQVLSNAKKYMHSANVENADNYSWVLLNMAKSYYKQQQYGTSFELTLESEQVARQFQISVINLAQILEHKSSLLTMQAKHKESEETINEALSLFKENSQEPIYCRLLFSRGMQCIQNEQFEKAIEYAQKSKHLVETIRGENDEQVGDALRIMGMAYCSISFRISNKSSEKEDNFNYGIKCLEKAIQIFSINHETRLQDQEAILGDLANIYEYTNNWKKAIMSYEQQRSVRIQILESVGLPANTDQIITLIDEKIQQLYAKKNKSQAK
ncbi:hypothetical protein ABPG74_015774 [Tetrahymena malaccensis]